MGLVMPLQAAVDGPADGSPLGDRFSLLAPG